ncbi:hypothetical protein [Mesorhizobium sp. WSM1293]|nr:hypothetical protein [Mesorhizobium sp. WSM1293]
MGLKAASFCVFLNLGAEILRAAMARRQSNENKNLHRASDASS